MTIKTFIVFGLLASKQLQEIAPVKRNSPKVLGTANFSRDFTEKEFASCLNNLQMDELENKASKIQNWKLGLLRVKLGFSSHTAVIKLPLKTEKKFSYNIIKILF